MDQPADPEARNPSLNYQTGCLIVVDTFRPNAASCLRLVSALLAECDEEWMSGKIYLTMEA